MKGRGRKLAVAGVMGWVAVAAVAVVRGKGGQRSGGRSGAGRIGAGRIGAGRIGAGEHRAGRPGTGRLRVERGLAALRLAARGGARYASNAPRLFSSAGEHREQLRNDLALQTAEDAPPTLGTMKA